MKKRIAALLLSVLMLCQVAFPTAQADEPKVYFTAAGESVLPLSDSTMPFWHNGYLYIPSTMFTDNVWRSLGISYIRNNRDVVILHSASQAAGRSLLFEPGKSYAKDSDDNIRQPGAVERGGIVFVPAFLVASFFGLQYSMVEVPLGYLVWLRKPDFGLSDKYFADAATYNMESAYNAYKKGKEKEKEKEPKQEITPEMPVSSGEGLYLCLEAGKSTAAMLDVLEQERGYATFFCTPDFLAEQGDLLRRMVATGQTIGILADPADERRTLEEQLDQGNQALEKATCGRTRLAYLKGGDEDDARRAAAMGFLTLNPDMDRTAYSLKSASNANHLMQRIAAHRGRVSVWMGDTADATGLRHFLAAVERADDRCFALTETAV